MNFRIIEYYDTWDENRLLRIDFERAGRYEVIRKYEMGYLSLRNWMKKVQNNTKIGLDGLLPERLEQLLWRFKK